ncbi:MAG: hypothetical protein WD489_10200 [Rhodovibrionaceae bacterium]
MQKFLVLFAALLLAAAAATYARYESFDPCVWIEQDLAAENGLPRLVVRARIQAEFLLRGIADPDAADCLLAWWDFRADGLQAKP